MKNLLHLSLIAVITLLLTTPAFAAKKNKDKGKHDPTASVKKKLDAADLPADVREKVKKVLADDSPKLKEAQAKIDGILTNEQKQAKRTAQKEARSSGTKRKQSQAAIEAAMKLTDEQKSKLPAAERELKSAQAAFMKDLQAVLTSDQMAKAGLKAKKKNKA